MQEPMGASLLLPQQQQQLQQLAAARRRLWTTAQAAGPVRGVNGGEMTAASTPVKPKTHLREMVAERQRERNAKRAGREAVTVAARLAAAEETTVKRILAKQSRRLLPSTLLDILTARIHKGEWDKALRLFKLLRAQDWYEPYAGTYVRLFDMLGRCRRPADAAALHAEMVSDGVRPCRESFTALMSAYTRNRMFSEAVDVLRAMNATPHCAADTVAYSLLIKAAADAGDHRQVASLLAEMDARGAAPNTVTFNTILAAQARAADTSGAAATLARMLSDPACRPDLWTVNAAVRCFGGAGLIAEMESWYTRLLPLTATGDTDVTNADGDVTNADGDVTNADGRVTAVPDSMTLHSLLDAYGRAGPSYFIKMHSVLRYMRTLRYPVGTVAYNILLSAYARAGRTLLLNATFKSMKAKGLKPDAVTYCTLISYQARNAGDGGSGAATVTKLLRHASATSVRADTAMLNAALDAYRRQPDLDAAERIFLGMTRDHGCAPDRITYATMAAAYREHRLPEKAAAMVTELRKLQQKQQLRPLFVNNKNNKAAQDDAAAF